MKTIIEKLFPNIYRKRQEENAENKRLYQEGLAILENRLEVMNDRRYANNRDYANSSNSKCPKCSSQNIVDKISRLNGSIDGSFSSSLFGGSGSVHGSTDTDPVNVCKNCGNEWKKSTYSYSGDTLKYKLFTIYWLMDDLNQANNCIFDKNDMNEKYSSKEEKKQALVDEFYEKSKFMIGQCQEFFKDISVKQLKLIIENYKHYSYENWLKEKLIDTFNEDFLRHVIKLK